MDLQANLSSTSNQVEVSQASQTVQTPQDTQTSTAWYESLPPEDMAYLKSKGWDKPGAEPFIFDSYKNLEKLHGAPPERLLKVPDVADKEGWSKVYERLGKPESPEQYDYKPGEGQTIDTNRLNWFSKTAHELGLNKEQHNNLVNAALAYENEIGKTYTEEQQRKTVADMEQLKSEWGNAFAERELLAQQGLASYLDDASSEEAVKTMQQILGVPAVLRLFAKIGAAQGEGKMPVTNGDRPFGIGPAQAKQQLEQLKAQIGADKARLDQFVTGTGFDHQEINRLLRIINNA